MTISQEKKEEQSLNIESIVCDDLTWTNIEGLNDTYDSLATNRTNEVVRMLTVIATILLPIAVVASIFGMNIRLGFFENSVYSILHVFLIMFAIVGGMLFFFCRQYWI